MFGLGPWGHPFTALPKTIYLEDIPIPYIRLIRFFMTWYKKRCCLLWYSIENEPYHHRLRHEFFPGHNLFFRIAKNGWKIVNIIEWLSIEVSVLYSGTMDVTYYIY